jgi:metal-dependent amidase/aminoacylase/carboxypeptidase family protein
MLIDPRILGLKDEVTAWRRDIHAHPETLYDVHRTAGIVATKLRSFGCDEVVEGIGKTGVVGLIHGRNGPSSACVPIWMLCRSRKRPIFPMHRGTPA